STPSCLLYRGEFAVVPGHNEMYLWYVNGSSVDQGIWKTTTGGSLWTQLNENGITNCGDLLGGCGTAQGIYNLELAAVPDGQTTDLYAGRSICTNAELQALLPVAAVRHRTLS